MAEPSIRIEPATRADVPAIVEPLADDEIGQAREDASADAVPRYDAAFARVEADPNSEILVARDGTDVIGCVQWTVLPGLSYQGASRLQIEDARVSKDRRGDGIGDQLIQAAEDRGKARGCGLSQLFVHGDRAAAQRFYARAGYAGAHLGFRKTF